MKMNARVDGLTEVKANLQALPEETRGVVSGYVGQWTDETLAGAQRRAPRGETGDLARSYGKSVRSDGLQAAVGSSLPRSRYAELGTRKARARPHLYPSFRTANRAFRERIKNTVTDLGKVRTRVRRLKRPRKVGA